MHKNTYRLLVIGILCFMLTAGVMLGYRFGNYIAKEDKINKIDVSKEYDFTPVFNDNEIKESSEPIVKNEFKIVKKTKYSLCDHEDYSEDIIISDSIDNALKDIDNSYKIESKSDFSVIASRTIDGYCSNHFIIKINNDKIVIYRMLDKTNTEVYSTINVPVNILREDVVEDLKEGITVDGIDDLNKLIQELES